MKEIELLVLEKMLAKLKLERAKMQFGNKYVFGFDDVLIIMLASIEELKK